MTNAKGFIFSILHFTICLLTFKVSYLDIIHSTSLTTKFLWSANCNSTRALGTMPTFRSQDIPDLHVHDQVIIITGGSITHTA